MRGTIVSIAREKGGAQAHVQQRRKEGEISREKERTRRREREEEEVEEERDERDEKRGEKFRRCRERKISSLFFSSIFLNYFFIKFFLNDLNF